ncbi:MAG: DUF4112 domain-containing protein, partial [Verrucomicrobiota bacterium]
ARASKRVSWLLDECIRIPGTNLRFGLDPILGLIPYGGEAVATVIGAVVLGEAGKKGLPFKTLIRMGGNMILNAGVGAFPVIGDLFSVWFKSNSRNYEMLNQFLDSEEGQEVRGGWWPLLVVITIIGIVVIINVATWLFVIGFWYYLLRQGLSNTATG